MGYSHWHSRKYENESNFTDFLPHHPRSISNHRRPLSNFTVIWPFFLFPLFVPFLRSLSFSEPHSLPYSGFFRMIFKSTIMAVTLASAVLAAPSQAENGIKVPLTKRDSSFADVNGKFDMGKAQVRDSDRSAVFVGCRAHRISPRCCRQRSINSNRRLLIFRAICCDGAEGISSFPCSINALRSGSTSTPALRINTTPAMPWPTRPPSPTHNSSDG